jgi:hypothetical protein
MAWRLTKGCAKLGTPPMETAEQNMAESYSENFVNYSSIFHVNGAWRYKYSAHHTPT